jgi:hypothetical protein
MKPTLAVATTFLVLLAAMPAQAQPEEPPDGDSSEAKSADDAAGDATAEPGADAEADPSADLETLRKQYRELRDRLFRSRARVNTVASELYSTKIRIYLDYGGARFYRVDRARIRLDGSRVFEDVNGVIADDRASRFEGYVAPGRHVVGIRVEATAKEDDRFRSIIEDTFTIDAPEGSVLVIRARARDGGDIPYKWSRKKRGSYKLHLDIKVEAKTPKKAGKKKRKKG